MSAINEQALSTRLNLSSIGESLLNSFIEKGRDSVLLIKEKHETGSSSKHYDTQNESKEVEGNYPAFLNMLNTDVTECDVEWAKNFSKAITDASNDDIKKYAKPTIDMLASLIYFLLEEKNSEKKKESESKRHDIPEKKIEAGNDSFTMFHYNIADDYENDEILRELTDGLDPKYLDPDFDLFKTTKIKKNEFDDYSLSEEGRKIYKTHQDIY